MCLCLCSDAAAAFSLLYADLMMRADDEAADDDDGANDLQCVIAVLAAPA